MCLLRVAAFASGRGSNLKAILAAIDRKELACKVVLVVSDLENSGALNLARERNIPALHINHKQFDTNDAYERALLQALSDAGTELIALAGYLKKISLKVIQAYRPRIVNIHPALLPAFGGKGMYGMNVHRAVVDYGCKISGVTVHLVDEEYDSGPPVLQRSVPVKEGDRPEDLARRVLEQEHIVYPQALQLFAEKRVEVKGRRVVIKPAGEETEK